MSLRQTSPYQALRLFHFPAVDKRRLDSDLSFRPHLIFDAQYNIAITPTSSVILPAQCPLDMRNWVPSIHLIHFVIDAIESVDTSMPQIKHRGTGNEQYPPAMLVVLLVYSYCTGMFSSRQIERSSYTDVAVLFLCANTHPDHDTICTFRRKNGDLLQRLSLEPHS